MKDEVFGILLWCCWVQSIVQFVGYVGGFMVVWVDIVDKGGKGLILKGLVM